MIKKNLIKNFFIILSIFLLDRVSKLYVLYLNKKNFNSEIFTSKFLNIYLIWNEGIAFGLLSFYQENLYNILTVIILIIILIILFFLIKAEGLKKYALLMVFGGAIGNLFDRIFYKAVPDFIDFHVGNFHWFIFNVSDIFITVGVIFLIYQEFVDKKGIK
tara:strand:- start:588 stop:1067 length:480 start_codon:yes stop_codon:yes gene_type:complete